MIVKVYCYLPNVIFQPLPHEFSVSGGTAWVEHEFEPFDPAKQKKQEILGSTLNYRAQANIEEFRRTLDPRIPAEYEAHFKKVGEILEKHRGIISEVATIVEGLVSMAAVKTFPAFGIEHVNVRLEAETPEEQAMIDKEEVMHTMGDVGKSREKQIITIGSADQMLAPIAKAEEIASVLAIYLTGIRAIERSEMEIAFTSFFRVVEGFLGDGSRNIEKALQKKSAELFSLLALKQEDMDALHRVLKQLSLPVTATSLTDHSGLIADIVLLRHVLMHYNLKNHDHHFYSAIRVDLKKLVIPMNRAAFILIRQELDGKKIPSVAPVK